MKVKKVASRRIGLRVVLASVTAAAVLAFAGCGKQLNAIEQNQYELQAMVQDGSCQVADGMAAVGTRQLELHSQIENKARQITRSIALLEQDQNGFRDDIRNRLESMLNNIASLESGQRKLRASLESNSQQLSNNIASVAAVDKNLIELRKMVRDVQDSTRQLTASVGTNSRQLSDNMAGVAAVSKNLTQLRKVIDDVQNNTRQLGSEVAAVEQNQLSRFHDLQGGVEATIGQIVSSVEAVHQNLLKLQEMVADVQNNTRQMDARIIVVEKGQVELRDKIESNISRIVRNAGAVDRLNRTVFAAPSPPETASPDAATPAGPADAEE